MAHAELLRLQDHSEALLGEVFQLDERLDNVEDEADELRVRRAEHYRNELVEQLRFNRTRSEIIRDELFRDHDGLT